MTFRRVLTRGVASSQYTLPFSPSHTPSPSSHTLSLHSVCLNCLKLGGGKISCYHLKGDSEYFSQKNQQCPKSTHKLPISPFSKYHKMVFHHFHPFFFLWLACMSNFSYGNCYKSVNGGHYTIFNIIFRIEHICLYVNSRIFKLLIHIN